MINFLIIGCPRSGTTLLSKVLTTHNKIVIPDETGFLFYLFGYTKIFSTVNLKKNKKQIFQKQIFKNCEKIQNFNEFLLIFRNSYIGNNKSILFGEKTPRHWYYLDLINLLMKDSKVIFILRNPFSVINSYKKYKQKWFPFYHTYRLFKMETFFPLFVWQQSLKKYIQYKNNNYYFLKYEDLTSNSENSIKEILSFLNLEYEEKMMSFYLENNTISSYVIKNENEIEAHKNLKKPINTERIFSDELLDNLDKFIIIKYLDKELKKYYPDLLKKLNISQKDINLYNNLYLNFCYLINKFIFNIQLKKNIIFEFIKKIILGKIK